MSVQDTNVQTAERGRPAEDTEPTPEDIRSGLALLQLLAEAADSLGDSPDCRWVHRRVAQLEFLDTRAVRWRISVDFTVPEAAPQIGGGQVRVVPISRWRKGDLVKLDFRDEQGTAIPLATAEDTTRLIEAALYQWVAHILQRNDLDRPELLKEIFAELQDIVSETPDPDRRKRSADTRLNDLLDRVSKGDPAVRSALAGNTEFCSQLYELSESFVVLAAVASPPGSRRIFKLAFESAVSFQHPHGWFRKIRQLFGWRDWRLEVMLGGRGGSSHLEAAAPTGVEIVKITAQHAAPLTSSAEHPTASTGITQEASRSTGPKWKTPTSAGKTPHVPIRVPAGPRRYRATIYLRVSLSGWLTASWLVALVIFISIFVGRLQLAALFAPAPAPGQAGTAASLLLALLGVFASWLIRPGEHPLAARLLRLARGLIAIDVAVLLIAVGNLLLHPATHQPNAALWNWLTGFAAAVALLLSCSMLLPPWPWRKVTTYEAPHREAAYRSEAEPTLQAAEGLPLQAPDGFSYGDEHSWGPYEQQALVQELTEVRKAAG
jgi:hypothetical protein